MTGIRIGLISMSSAAIHICSFKLIVLYQYNAGLFVVMGATAALAPTPGMLAYGLSKNAVHHVVQTLGTKGELVKSAEPATVIAILPSMLDTPANRSHSPEVTDYGHWTKTKDIAEEIGRWITTPDFRPHSGSLVKVFPDKSGKGAVFRLAR